MRLYGYARVSSTDQDCALQIKALEDAGCCIVLSEKRSGTTTEGRDQLELALGLVQAGDALVVTRIDRLARSVADLERIVSTLRAKDAHLRATEQPIDTTSPAGVAFLQMLGVFAQFETALRKERQLEGIAKAKAAGVYKGREPSVPGEKIRQLRAEGRSPTEIAKELLGKGKKN